jgi:hypothetical protein|tara:strand:+ start:11450 stop:11974 length:525 start_codon:yes stop_codon:yes gene_type:complete
MTSLQNIDKQKLEMEIFAPMNPDFNRKVLKMTMDDVVKVALDQKPVSLYKAYKHEEEKTIDILMLMLIQFQNFYGCKSKMEKTQLEEVSYLIIQQFRHLNYYDLAMCLKLAKLNEKIYDRIDGGMILEWLTKYEKQRTDMIVCEREKQKAQNNAEWSGLGERSSEISIKDFFKK